MTQEEKAKAYDEAIIKAKALYGQPLVDNTLLETILPKLKESEDEKVRKALVEMVHDTTGDELWIDYNVHKEDALAWLEKQGNIPVNVNKMVRYYANNKECGNEAFGKPLNCMIRAYRQGLIDVISTLNLEKQDETFTKKDIDDAYLKGINDAKNELKKQGEQKETLCNECKKEQPSHSCQDITALGRCAIEKQGEQETDEWKEGNIIRHGGILALVIKGRRAMKSNGEIFTVQYPDEWVKAAPNEIEHFLNELENRGEKPQGKTALEAINEEKVDNANKVEPKFKVGDWIVNKGHSYLIADIDYSEQRYLFEIGGYTHEQLNWEYIEIADKRYHLWSIQDAKDGDVLVDVYEDIGIFEKRYGINWHTHCYLDCRGRFIPEGGSHGSICYPATKEQRDQLEKAMTDAGYTFDFEKKELKLLITNGGDFCESENCEQKTAWDEEDEHTLQGVIDEIQANKNQAPDYEFETYDRFLFWLKTLKHRIGG